MNLSPLREHGPYSASLSERLDKVLTIGHNLPRLQEQHALGVADAEHAPVDVRSPRQHHHHLPNCWLIPA